MSLIEIAKKANATPLSKWPHGWLRFETASILDLPKFLRMTDDEKRAAGYPVTEDEMRAFIKSHRPETPDDI